MQGKAQSLFSKNINNFGHANHNLSIPIEIVSSQSPTPAAVKFSPVYFYWVSPVSLNWDH